MSDIRVFALGLISLLVLSDLKMAQEEKTYPSCKDCKTGEFMFGESDVDFVFGESESESDISSESIQMVLHDTEDFSNDSIQDYSGNYYDPAPLNLTGIVPASDVQDLVSASNHCEPVGEADSIAGPSELVGENVNFISRQISVLEVSKKGEGRPNHNSSPKVQEQNSPDMCSIYCKNDCSKVFKSWPKETIDDLLKEFSKKTLFDRKQALLSHVIKQSYMGIKKRGIFWNSHIFCVKFFSKITSISTYHINLAISDHFKHGIKQYVHGNSGCPKERPATIRFIAWMVQHVEIFGQDAPDEITKIMSSAFKKRELYQTYVNETQAPRIKLSTFYSHLKTKFGLQRPNQKLPNVRFSKYTTHTRCDTCVTLDRLQRTSRTQEHLLYCRALRYKHRERFGKARQAIANLKQLSLSFPNEFLTIHCDDMDNQKSMLPRIMEPGKALSGCYKIPTKLTGTITTSGLFPTGRNVAFFYNHDEFENGSNKMVSVLYKLLLRFLNEFKFLPRHLNLCLDNCFKENKNRYLFAFLASLVELNVFTEVTVNYLLVGHTGNEVDQLFSIVANALKREICTIEELVSIISNSSIQPKPSCEPLDYIWDWKAFIIPNLYVVPLSQHSNFHCFQIKKESGSPRFRAKKYPQDSTFTPPNGKVLLKDNIVYSPVPAADFRVDELCLDVVFRDLNKFISRMSSSEAIRVRQSWDRLRERLEKKPHRQKNLPPMKILELPKQQNSEQISIPAIDELEDDLPELGGEEFPSELNEGDFESEVVKNMDLVLYTERTVGRPWVGRVLEVLQDSCFILHWFGRKSRGNTFHALYNKDKTAYTSKQSCSSVMLWEMGIEKEEKSFRLTNKTMEKIMSEYAYYDNLDKL